MAAHPKRQWWIRHEKVLTPPLRARRKTRRKSPQPDKSCQWRQWRLMKTSDNKPRKAPISKTCVCVCVSLDYSSQDNGTRRAANQRPDSAPTWSTGSQWRATSCFTDFYWLAAQTAANGVGRWCNWMHMDWSFALNEVSYRAPFLFFIAGLFGAPTAGDPRRCNTLLSAGDKLDNRMKPAADLFQPNWPIPTSQLKPPKTLKVGGGGVGGCGGG